MSDNRIVVIGGGNGTSRLMTSLLPLLHDGSISSLHALVHMCDDGGSTGRLREQYGVAAMGDLTKCMLALEGITKANVRGAAFMQALNYRFTSGDFQGHTVRNILLTALELTSDIDSALATLARILQIPKTAGAVPTTLSTLTQQVQITIDGNHNVLGEGEHFIAHHVNLQADPHWQPGSVRVTFREHDVPLNQRALALLQTATHILVAPGHTYGSILPSLALPSLGEAIAQTSAQIGIVMTLLTTPRQTSGWHGEDFVTVYESYLHKKADFVIANTGKPSVSLVSGQEWVPFSQKKHSFNLMEHDVVSTVQPEIQAGDTVPRAIIVHDTQKLETVFRGILKGDD